MVETDQAHRTTAFAGDAKLDPDRRYSSEIAARYLGCTQATLAKWRCYKRGPNYIKVGKVITYRGCDLLAFEASCLVALSRAEATR